MFGYTMTITYMNMLIFNYYFPSLQEIENFQKQVYLSFINFNVSFWQHIINKKRLTQIVGAFM